MHESLLLLTFEVFVNLICFDILSCLISALHVMQKINVE